MKKNANLGLRGSKTSFNNTLWHYGKQDRVHETANQNFKCSGWRHGHQKKTENDDIQ